MIIRRMPTPSTPNHGRNNGTKAIKDNKIDIIKLTGVNSNSSNNINEAIKCQITIKQVAWINFVISPISYCLFYEKMCLSVR